MLLLLLFFFNFYIFLLWYVNYFVHELWTEHACVQIFHAATFSHQPQHTFFTQTQAVALYPASTPALGPQAGPPPYPAASNASPPYPAASNVPLHLTLAFLLCHLALLTLTDQSKSCIRNQFARSSTLCTLC